MTSSKKNDLKRDFAAGVYHSSKAGETVSHVGIFDLDLWTVATVTFYVVQSPSPTPCVNKYAVYINSVKGGGGYGVLAFRQMNTCFRVLLQVNFSKWRHFALPSVSLIFLWRLPSVQPCQRTVFKVFCQRQRDQRGVASADCWTWGKRTHWEHMKGVLPMLVCWALWTGRRDFFSCLGCSSQSSTKNIFFLEAHNFAIHLSPLPSKLGRQSCRTACLLISVSGQRGKFLFSSWKTAKLYYHFCHISN